MTFNWKGYLELARVLVYEDIPIPSQEAKYRSAISRTYYAAFNVARLYIEQSTGTFFQGEATVHQQVIEWFSAQPDKDKRLCRTIYDDLGRLRRDRNHADYRDGYRGGLGEAEQKAQESLITAQRIINNISRLPIS